MNKKYIIGVGLIISILLAMIYYYNKKQNIYTCTIHKYHTTLKKDTHYRYDQTTKIAHGFIVNTSVKPSPKLPFCFLYKAELCTNSGAGGGSNDITYGHTELQESPVYIPPTEQ